jgi:hypothetical protein
MGRDLLQITLSGLIISVASFLWAADVTLVWDAPTCYADGTPVSGELSYKVYYGTQSGEYAPYGQPEYATQCTVTGLQEGVTYHFAVRSCTTSGTESELTDELIWSAPDVTPPAMSAPARVELRDSPDGGFVVPAVRDLVELEDNCSSEQDIVFTQDPLPGSIVQTCAVEIELTATDEAGNSSRCTVAARAAVLSLVYPDNPYAINAGGFLLFEVGACLNRGTVNIELWCDGKLLATLASGISGLAEGALLGVQLPSELASNNLYSICISDVLDQDQFLTSSMFSVCGSDQSVSCASPSVVVFDPAAQQWQVPGESGGTSWLSVDLYMAPGQLPQAGLTITNRCPRFGWIPLPGATSYQVCVMKNGRPFINRWVEGVTSWTCDVPMRDGTYEWRVRGQGEGIGEQPWSHSVAFTVAAGPNPWPKAVPHDYDGDGQSDVGIFRPSEVTWYVFQSDKGPMSPFQFGAPGDLPVPADYDGDGQTDLAVYRPSTMTWYVFGSSSGAMDPFVFGGIGDLPVPADYDGDGMADLAVYRPSTMTWYVFGSSAGPIDPFVFGGIGDRPVPADYDGDGRADLAVFRPSNVTWYVFGSSAGAMEPFQFGTHGDVPVPGDYDGDGQVDMAIFRPSDVTWYIFGSSAGPISPFQFGTIGDAPIL